MSAEPALFTDPRWLIVDCQQAKAARQRRPDEDFENADSGERKAHMGKLLLQVFDLGTRLQQVVPEKTERFHRYVGCLGLAFGARKERFVLRCTEVVADDDGVEHRHRGAALPMQDFRRDGDQYAFDLNRRMEEFAKRPARVIEIEQVSILRDSGEDRLAVRGHALMDAMHVARAVNK